MSDTEKIKKLEAEIADLKLLVLGMQNYNTITPEFKKVIDRGNIGTSSKVSSSENQSVNEAGSSTWNVLKAPDAFLETTVGGTLYYIPVFT